MKFPEEYIEYGRFKLHSGQTSDTFYDINALLTNPLYFLYVLHNLPFSAHYVGIATGGALMAVAVHTENPASKLSIIKDGVLLGEKPIKPYALFDDVVKTENSLLEAISLAGSEPEKIIVAVDRRTEKRSLIIKSIFEI